LLYICTCSNLQHKIFWVIKRLKISVFYFQSFSRSWCLDKNPLFEKYWWFLMTFIDFGCAANSCIIPCIIKYYYYFFNITIKFLPTVLAQGKQFRNWRVTCYFKIASRQKYVIWQKLFIIINYIIDTSLTKWRWTSNLCMFLKRVFAFLILLCQHDSLFSPFLATQFTKKNYERNDPQTGEEKMELRKWPFPKKIKFCNA